METLIGRVRKTNKHAADELKKKAAPAFLERVQKRKPTDPAKRISHWLTANCAPPCPIAYALAGSWCAWRWPASRPASSRIFIEKYRLTLDNITRYKYVS